MFMETIFLLLCCSHGRDCIKMLFVVTQIMSCLVSIQTHHISSNKGPHLLQGWVGQRFLIVIVPMSLYTFLMTLPVKTKCKRTLCFVIKCPF